MLANGLEIKDAAVSWGLRVRLVTTISPICPFSCSSNTHIQSLVDLLFLQYIELDPLHLRCCVRSGLR